VHQPSDSAIYTTNFHDEEGKQGYIDLINSLATYTTDEKITTDDRLVILSTCAYEYQNARYMVVGKMVPWE
jgi:sortase B